mgnify:CR=1 FL=1
MEKKIILHRMLKSKFFLVGFLLAVILVGLAIAAPHIVHFDPTANSLTEKFTPPEWFSKGLDGHVLGTDNMGRDILTRLLVGAGSSFTIAAFIVLFSGIIGTVLGLVSGYAGGAVDTIIMRTCEVFMSIPQIVLAIAVVAMIGANTVNLILVLTITNWTSYCKLTRNNVLVIKRQEFVSASKVQGASHMRIIFKQIFPNVTTPLIIQVSQQFGMSILLEATLSFLNLGIQPPAPSWGNMIANCRQYLTTAPWTVFAPGIALMLTVLAFNFLGDGLRDVLDPKRI